MKMPDQHPLWKPKFLMAAFVQVMGTVALFTHFLDGGSWIAASALALGVFTAGSVVENKAMMNAP